MFPLKCSIQNYAWGKLGHESEVASLQKASDPAFQINESTPYAEVSSCVYVCFMESDELKSQNTCNNDNQVITHQSFTSFSIFNMFKAYRNDLQLKMANLTH